jgi:dihydrofolate reductase
MRSLVYSVAASLDGFIAGPQGEHDWIVFDPSFDFAALWDRFDTLVMGRLTYEVARTRFKSLESMGKKIVVASTTLEPAQHPGISVVSADIPGAVVELKSQPGKDIWLMGGGALFRGLLDAGLVDTVEVAVVPVLLGSGVPLVPVGRRHVLHLAESKVLTAGIVQLFYRMGN